MKIKDIRKKLAAGGATIGSWLQLPSPDAAEIMAGAGYDWLAIDMEHGSFGPDRLPDMIRAIECGGAAPFARLPEAAKVHVKAALEAGAQGVIFPMIESAEQLEKAISLCLYPGEAATAGNAEALRENRGVGYCRANRFGREFDAYMKDAAAEVFIVAQIESMRAVENLSEILRVRRLDAIMVGPYDLSGSMGLTGKFDHPRFREVMDHISRACREQGMIMGAHVVMPDPAALRAALDSGCRFVAYGIDSVFLWNAAQRPAPEA